MSACGPSSGRAVWVPLWVPNWLGRTRYGTHEPDQIWLTGAKLWFPDGAVTPEVAGPSPVAPGRRARSARHDPGDVLHQRVVVARRGDLQVLGVGQRFEVVPRRPVVGLAGLVRRRAIGAVDAHRAADDVAPVVALALVVGQAREQWPRLDALVEAQQADGEVAMVGPADLGVRALQHGRQVVPRDAVAHGVLPRRSSLADYPRRRRSVAASASSWSSPYQRRSPAARLGTPRTPSASAAAVRAPRWSPFAFESAMASETPSAGKPATRATQRGP